MKKFLSIITLSILGLTVNAQQDAQFTQYFDNTLFVNPAYAGSNDMLNVTGIHRQQWVGFAGRPVSTTMSIHSPIVKRNMGLGLTFVDDRVGPITQNLFYADFSYTLNFANSPGQLSFGAKGGINVLNSKSSELNTIVDQDQKIISNVRNAVSPNFGFGMYYHTPKWFAGISAPKLLEYDAGDVTNVQEQRHYFLMAGGVIPINRIWKLRPTTNLKFTEGAPLSIDLSVAGIYNETLWLGVMHRWADSFGAFVQYQITPQFKVGCAYDQTVTALRSYNSGTYEILLSYDFVFENDGIRSPRYF